MPTMELWQLSKVFIFDQILWMVDVEIMFNFSLKEKLLCLHLLLHRQNYVVDFHVGVLARLRVIQDLRMELQELILILEEV